MIRLSILDYSKHNKLNYEITEYMNQNLKIIIRVLLDFMEDDAEFGMDGFLPRDYIEREPIEARRMVNTLNDMISSRNLRDYIKPKYEYLLFHVLHWWYDCSDDFNELIPKPIPDDLRERILHNKEFLSDDNENHLLNDLEDFKTYFYILFDDHDFLQNDLENLVTLYLRSPNTFEMLVPDVQLIDYVDLMPNDLRELFLERINEYSNNDNFKLNQHNNLSEDIVIEFNAIIQMMEKRIAQIKTRDEVEISDDIYQSMNRLLARNFELSSTREMTIGRANKKLGETDLYIFKNSSDEYRDVAIVENKVIENFKSQFLQLFGYLNQNFEFGITISINKNWERYKAIENIQIELEKLKESHDIVTINKIYQPFKEYSNILASTHVIPEEPRREMIIYHMVINLCDKERVLVAKEARRKK